MFNYLRAMYHAHPIRQDIAGTVESIAKITPDHLYRCYRTFYNLHNMAFVLAGSFDVDRVCQLLDQMLKPCDPVTVRRVFPEEPATVARPRVEEALSVALPLFQFGYKLPGTAPRGEKDLAAAEVLLEVLASEASPLFRRCWTAAWSTSPASPRSFSRGRLRHPHVRRRIQRPGGRGRGHHRRSCCACGKRALTPPPSSAPGAASTARTWPPSTARPASPTPSSASPSRQGAVLLHPRPGRYHGGRRGAIPGRASPGAAGALHRKTPVKINHSQDSRKETT